MRSLITSISLYACESWTLTAELQRRIQAMEMRCHRKVLRISYKDHVTNEEVRAKIQRAIGLPFLQQPPLLCKGWGGHPLCLSGDSSVFCPSVQYLSLFCEAFSWTILDSSRFPLFHSGQVFHQLVCPLTVVLRQIFFNLTTLFSCPVFSSLFHAPLDVVVHFLVFLRSFIFRLKSVLSQFSSFVAEIKNFCSNPGFFF